MLRESGSLLAVLDGARAADPHAVGALVHALTGLGEQFGEFASVAADLRSVARVLEEEVLWAAAERRATAARAEHVEGMIGRILEGLESVGARGVEPGWAGCPYPGLAPFSEADARVFFGRADMTRRLVRAVAGHARSGGLLLVLGASGAGKSSLLRAGLVPALARGQAGAWPTRVITPTARPLRELAAHLADLSGREAGEVAQLLSADPSRAAGLAREALARRARAGGDESGVLVLVVDQLEELFTLVTADSLPERNGFVRALHALCASPSGRVGATPAAVVVAAVRGDYLDQAASLPVVADAVGSGAFLVGPMTRAELREVIEGPAEQAGFALESQMTEVVLAEAYGAGSGPAAGPGVLPLVSQAMAATWRLRGGRQLTLNAYRRLAGLPVRSTSGHRASINGSARTGAKRRGRCSWCSHG